MFKYYRNDRNQLIAELTDGSVIINYVQDAVDLLGELGEQDCSRIIIKEGNLHKDFFDLKTGLAGEILQKFSNYHVSLAIVGDFSKFQSKSLKDFIRESNRGNAIFFVDNKDAAIKKLSIK